MLHDTRYQGLNLAPQHRVTVLFFVLLAGKGAGPPKSFRKD